MVQLQWAPEQHFVLRCFRCGEAEMIFVGESQQPQPQNLPDPTFTPEERLTIAKIAEKHTKEKEVN